jgi:hypothetical protein
MNSDQEIYAILFIMTTMLFLGNLLIQGQISFSYSDSLGLISIMGVPFWIGYVLLTVLACFQFSRFDSIGHRYAFLTILLFVMYLILTPFLYEKLPRFEDTWSHSFTAQQMFAEGKVDVGYSIYEEYPGALFLFGQMFSMAPSYLVMQFFPPIFYIFGAFVVFLLFRKLFGGKSALLIVILYIFFNWTVEDNHISPQFLILNLYFLFMYITIKFIDGNTDRRKYFAILGLMAVAIVFSHPLTPLFLIMILGSVFLFCKRYRIGTLAIVVMLLAIFVPYEFFRTTTFSIVAQDVGGFLASLASGSKPGITQRFAATNAAREMFLASRVGITLISAAMGLAGAIFMHRDGHKTEAKFFFAWAAALIPFTLIVGLVIQGEFYERFALISSLPLAALSVYAINKFKFGFIALLIFLLALYPPYFIGKYGNEAFESVSMEKLNANCYNEYLRTDCASNLVVIDARLRSVYEVGNVSVISREDIMSNSIFTDNSISGVKATADSLADAQMLSRIYSTNNAWVYR